MIQSDTIAIGWNTLHELLPGDIVHVRTPGSWMSALTRWFERDQCEQPSWSSHSGIIGNGVPTVIEALWRVTERPLTAYKGKSRVVVTRCPVSISTAFAAAGYARAYLGAKYGWWKLIHHSANKAHLIGKPSRPICSYLVAHAYALAARMEFGKPAPLIQPDDLLDHAIHNNWPVVWCDSTSTLAELKSVYHERDAYVRELESKSA